MVSRTWALAVLLIVLVVVQAAEPKPDVSDELAKANKHKNNRKSADSRVTFHEGHRDRHRNAAKALRKQRDNAAQKRKVYTRILNHEQKMENFYADKIKKHTKELNVLGKRLAAAVSARKIFKDRRDNIQKKLKKVRDEIRSLKGMNAGQRKTLKNFQAHLQDAQVKLAKAQAELKSTRASLKSLNGKIKNLEAKQRTGRRLVENYRERSETEASKMFRVSQQLKKVKEQLDKVNQEIGKRQLALKSLRAQLAKLNGEQNANNSLRKTKTTARAQINDKIRKELASINTLTKKIRIAKNQKRANTKKAKDAQGAAKRNYIQAAASKRKRQVVTGRRDTLKGRLTTLRNNRKSLRNQRTTLKEQLTALNLRTKQLEGEIASKTSEIRKKVQELLKLKHGAVNAEKISEKRAQLRALRRQYDTLRRARDKYTDAVAKAKSL